MVEEFRNAYPAHPAGICVYGDATGNARTGQTAQSDYDLLRIALRGYPTPISWKVPADNPDEKDRRNAFNAKLKPPDGMPGMRISPKCKELIEDLQAVVLRPDQKKILKVYDGKDPYARRTHASDAAGYLVSREWPLVQVASSALRKPSAPAMKPGRLLGDIAYVPRVRGR
jgi:hypothetical protein